MLNKFEKIIIKEIDKNKIHKGGECQYCGKPILPGDEQYHGVKKCAVDQVIIDKSNAKFSKDNNKGPEKKFNKPSL